MTEPLQIDPNSDFARAPEPAPLPPPPLALVRRNPFDSLVELETHLEALDRVVNVLCKATILPRDMQTPANLKLVLLQGLAMGFDVVQAIRASYIITSKDQPPRVGYYVEALVALVRRSEVCRFFRVEAATSEMCRVVCARKDEDEAVIHVFEMTIAQARAANLDKKFERGDDGRWAPVEKYTWKASPADMLRNRICGRAVKSVFQDVVYGMATPDEIDDAQEAAESNGAIASSRFAAVPVTAPVRPSAPAEPRTVREPQEAELVDEGSGDAAWDALLAEVAVRSGAVVNGWVPDDLLEEFAKRAAAATTRGELNGLSSWITPASALAGRSKICGEVATKMRDLFNTRAAEIKAAAPKSGAA